MVGSKVTSEDVEDTLLFSQKGFALTGVLWTSTNASKSLLSSSSPLLHLFSTQQPYYCI